jgi:hypothetical protein
VIRVKHRDGTWVFQEGADRFDGGQLVRYSLEQASYLVDGATETLAARVERLAEIIGMLVDRVPEADRIEVCQLDYVLERV